MERTRDERLELIEALTSLQKTHKAIIDKYTIDTRARLSWLLELLRGKTEIDSERPSVPRSRAKEMLQEVKGLKLKPEKGRGKDLYRIEKLLVELEETCQGT